MEMLILRVLIFTSVCGLSAKHVFITAGRSWQEAQKYCRSYYTDLSPITSELENQVFRKSVHQESSGWIGLHRDSNSPTGWKWSGGEYATYQDWAYGLNWAYGSNWVYGSNYYGYVYWNKNGWYVTSSYSYSFFCLNLIVVEEKKTWEEALEHCRGNHTDLTSLLSKTENLLALSEIQHDHITERVWIGLRYLEDRWLWMNGDTLVYQVWPQGGDQDHLCPIWKRCGALTKEGQWENRDCQEKLNFICI